MSHKHLNAPLIAIVGETGSGKSALAMHLAQQCDGEIICADSRTVYRGMDIGTAKPSQQDRTLIRHYGLDLVGPDDPFTVADFKAYAQDAIHLITKVGKLPILVGGSGLYIDAVLYDFAFRAPADSQRRAELETLNVEQLQARLTSQTIELPNNPRNPRHLIRTLETAGVAAIRHSLRAETLILGVQIERDVLRQRITERVDRMLADGLVAEARALSKQYGWDCQALQAPGYKDVRSYTEGTRSLEQLTTDIIKNHMDLAKRQRTWFKRNKSIHWLIAEYKQSEAVDIATTFLNK